MLRNVYLYGSLADKYGKQWQIDCLSVPEAVKAIGVNADGFVKDIRKGEWIVIRGDLEGGSNLETADLFLQFHDDKPFHILPKPEGDSGGMQIIGGAILAFAGLLFPPVAGFLIPAGVGLMAGGLAQELTPATPRPQRFDEEEGYTFRGPVNRTTQGGPVPLVYGGLDMPVYTGSVQISDSFHVGFTPPRPQFMVMDLLAEGNIGGLYDGNKSIYLNEVPLEDASGNKQHDGYYKFGIRTGTSTQSASRYFSQVTNAVSVNALLEAKGGSVIRRITDDDVDAFSMLITMDRLYSQGDSGKIYGVNLNIRVDVRADGGSWNNNVLDQNYDGNSPLHQDGLLKKNTFTIEAPNIDLREYGDPPYDIRVTKVRPTMDNGDTSDANHTWYGNVYWTNYTEIKHVRLRYPYSAWIGWRFDSKFWPQIPQRIYGLQGRKILYPSNYTPATRSYSGAWDGTFSRGITDNPAWIFYDLLREERACGGIDATYLSDTKWDLYSIGRYCDETIDDGFGSTEPRYRFNGVINSRQEALNVISQIASTFRGMVYWSAANVGVTQDKPTSPTRLFTNANVKSGEFFYEGAGLKDIHTVVYVTYQDPNNFGRPAIQYVQHDASLRRYGYNELRVTAYGCQSRGQAHRFGKWILDTEYYTQETVRFTAGLEAIDLVPGEVITIADQFHGDTRYGARVTSVDAGTKTIRIEGSFTKTAGIDYTLNAFYRNVDDEGRVETQDIVSASAYSSTETDIVVDNDFLNWPSNGDIVIISESGDTEENTRDFRVINVVEKSLLEYEVTAIEYDDDKYDRIESNNYLDTDPFDNEDDIIDPPSNIQVSDDVYSQEGRNYACMQIHWDPSDDRRTRYYEVVLIRTA